ncbi:hypothetical protein Tsubulata_001791 [Turnera subulata]|uniref:Small nuclear RNA activating complex (SNAPc), subunit SNAP43 protein n=1 Tax=Turnera subulata TaxID=218843 RepID=A0A9Q0FHX0_9ROSI|nr:hypothetical protein Tsubulata_001791 [Turnera subulata]
MQQQKGSCKRIDMYPFKLDIDELIDEFAERGSTTLADMKRIWMSRKFSYIYEAKPSTGLSFFMQSLYAHTIGHMVSNDSLSRRLGALYCLYCLYEIQPFKPPFKIYISLGELEKLNKLVVDAKEQGVKVATLVVKKMLEKNAFLFGSVDLNEGSVNQTVTGLSDLQNKRIKCAYNRLIANSGIEELIHMDMGMHIDLNRLKRMSTAYSEAKRLAIQEAGEVVDIQNIKHISDDGELIGDVVEKINENWNTEREMYYLQTGLKQHPAPDELHPYQQQCQQLESQDVDNIDDFSRQLELELFEEESQ